MCIYKFKSRMLFSLRWVLGIRQKWPKCSYFGHIIRRDDLHWLLLEGRINGRSGWRRRTMWRGQNWNTSVSEQHKIRNDGDPWQLTWCRWRRRRRRKRQIAIVKNARYLRKPQFGILGFWFILSNKAAVC